jgi:hypothetical protein
MSRSACSRFETYTTAKSKPQDLHAEIDPRELRDELFIGYSDTPHVLRDVVNKYFRKCGVKGDAAPLSRQLCDRYFAGGFHSRDYAAAELRRAIAAVVGGEPEAQGQSADNRSRRRLSR